jgi:hypothetical protein
LDFYHSLKSITSAGFELVNLGSSGKHPNHYTTKVTCGNGITTIPNLMKIQSTILELLVCDHTEAEQTRQVCLLETLITDLNGSDTIA